MSTAVTPTIEAASTAPDIAPTSYPNAVLGLVGGPPSQSEADAQRDGVMSDVAWLSFADRVEIQAEVNVDGQRWVISRFPLATWSALPDLGVSQSSLDPGSSELLHLDANTIVQSVPMISAPATWITASGPTIYAGRNGDGGYPDDTLVRLNTMTGSLDRLRLPWSFERERIAFPKYQWDLVAPSSAALLRARIDVVVQGDISAETLGALDQAIEDTVTFNPYEYEIPVLALSRSSCDLGDAEFFFDFGTHCVVEEGSRVTDDTSVVISGEHIPGTLVGVGWMDTAGPTYAAVVAAPGEFSEPPVPLLFVDINDPSNVWNPGLDGRGPAFQIEHVSFFEGGFVTTAAVDLGARVEAYDMTSQPYGSFVSPTERDLGYPPNPAVGFANASQDGRQLAYAEREWPLDGSSLPGEGLAIVVADSSSGDELRRVTLTLDRHEMVGWLDFDGRWIVVSFRTFGSPETTESIPARAPIMIEVATGEVFPLGFDQPDMVTIERQNAPEEERVRIMTSGPYRHGQTVTLRLIPGPLTFQHGERQPNQTGSARLCASPDPLSECVQLPVTRSTSAFDVPIEFDVTITEIVGHLTKGDVEADRTYDCQLGGCVLAGMPIEFVAEAAPAKPTLAVDIDDGVASVEIEAAVFDSAQLAICFARGSNSELQHRNTTVRVSFCTDFANVDFASGAASVVLDLRDDLALACSIRECATQLFYIDT